MSFLSTPGGRPEGRVCTLCLSARPCLHLQRTVQPGLSTLQHLHCYSIWTFQCADTFSLLFVHPVCPLPLSLCYQQCMSPKNNFLFQLNAFFWIFSLAFVCRVGSLYDDVINILMLSWFFSHLLRRRNMIKLSKTKVTLLTRRKIFPAINFKQRLNHHNLSQIMWISNLTWAKHYNSGVLYFIKKLATARFFQELKYHDDRYWCTERLK